MKFNYWQIISHIVPGFILSVNIIVILNLCGFFDLSLLLDNYGLFVPFYILVSLPLGIIIDGFHHRFIANIYKFFIIKNEKKNSAYLNCKNEMKYIKDIGLDILDRIYHSYYVFSEAYVNIATSFLLIPIIIIFCIDGSSCLKVIFTSITIIVISFLYWSGYESRSNHYEALSTMISEVKTHNKRMHQTPSRLRLRGRR